MGIMSMVGTGLAIVKGGIDLLTGRQKRKEREEYRDAGQTKAERDQLEEGHEARERMDSVKPADSGTTAGRLRKHDF